ncbi:MAG: hypothetical protein QY323_04825 [Patescibacteria group bacterium]|nr:MAG: hypothetical protein QY323_04825 [Patescibacteria group bacterium]
MKLIRSLVNKVKWLYRNKWGLCLALLVVAGLLSIDWSAEQEDPHMRDCAIAHRQLGEDLPAKRPDCIKYLPASSTSR